MTTYSSARGFARATPRLPQPLTPQSIVGLMREPAYWDATHPRFPTYQRLVKRGFEILYPGPERRDDTGMIINVKPLPPEHVAHLVEQTNREMAAMDEGLNQRTGSEKTHDGMMHVESHTRDGGKTEVSDYWRNPPNHGGDDADQSAPENKSDSGPDTLRGQAGEDNLPNPNTPREPSQDAFVAPDPDKLVRDWSDTWRGEKEEKRECVDLIKEAIPEVGRTSTWQEGEKLIGPGNPPLKPGTAIATFDKDGKYINKSGESHAGIFLEYGTHNGKDGMWILDQHQGQRAGKTLSFV